MANKPHIVLVIPRGEAVRNFLYSQTLPALAEQARVTLLSVIHDEAFRERFGPYVEQIIPLQEHREAWLVNYLRYLIHEAHFRWLWSEVARNRWEVWDHRSASNEDAWDPRDKTAPPRWQLALRKLTYTLLANRPTLRLLTHLENWATYALRPVRQFDDLFTDLAPDLVFNGSHIHGMAGELPLKVAARQGIPTAGFIFSWDNLTSRSRIFVPYDYYFVWHDNMNRQLLDLYPEIAPEQVFITGTPQFDFHFQEDFWLTREELAAAIGFDPARPFILYTTGIDVHFPEEHRTVKLVIDALREMPVSPRPQLVVRTYVKGVSDEMKALAAEDHPDVYWPDVQWDPQWYMPAYTDLSIYTSLIREACMGINPASTVSLELLMHDKPVLNLAFDPPGSDLPDPYRWERHIQFDHYRPVAESGAVMVARQPEDVPAMLQRGLTQPTADSARRHEFINEMFGDTLDGQSGRRIAQRLIALAARQRG